MQKVTPPMQVSKELEQSKMFTFNHNVLSVFAHQSIWITLVVTLIITKSEHRIIRPIPGYNICKTGELLKIISEKFNQQNQNTE